MEKSYIIIWASRTKDRAGIGQKAFSEAECNQLVSELNKNYPEIEHQALDQTKSNPEEALRLLRISACAQKPLGMPFPELAGLYARTQSEFDPKVEEAKTDFSRAA